MFTSTIVTFYFFTTTATARTASFDDGEIRSCVWNILWPLTGHCNQLTPWSRDLLGKLLIVQLVVELPAVFGTHIFVT
jgi:hypothetical protein